MPFLIKETKDYQMIKEMLWDDKELYDRISDDYTDIKNWHPETSTWLGCFEDGRCLALLSVKEENAIVLNIHMHIPDKNRGSRSFEIGNGLVDAVVENCDKRFTKINIKIPVVFPDVIKFAEKVGFQHEGIDRKSHIRNGVVHNRAILGRVLV